MSRKPKGKIIIPAGIVVWRHELETANALASTGYEIKFLKENNQLDAKSPDVVIAGKKWEIKSPRTDKLSAVERNLKRATRQSGNIILDAHRLSRIHDKTVQNFLLKKYKQQRTIKSLLFINRKREVIDIGKLIR